MNLDKVELTGFLRHKQLTLDFQPGVTLLRGPNEAGKTSVFEAIGYNWFGSEMLQEDLASTVTRGEPESSLKTVTRFSHGGKKFECRRGASGAELRDGNGTVLVTGHKAVTAKLEELTGVPPGRARDTIFAEQDAVRGILSAGPTAAASFIEKLAGLDEIESIIKRVESLVETGPTKAYDEQLAAAKEALAALPDVPAPEVAEQLRAMIAGIERQIEESRAGSARRQVLEGELSQLRQSIKRTEKQRASLEATVAAGVDAPAALRAAEALREAAAKRTDYESFLRAKSARDKVVEQVGGVWEGTQEDLNAEIRAFQTKIIAFRSEASSAEGEVRGLRGQKISSTTCPTCGQSIGDPKEAARINAEIDTKLAALAETTKTAKAAADALQKDLGDLQALNTCQQQLLGLQLPGVIATTGEIPQSISWEGEVPSAVAVDEQEISRLKTVVADSEAAARLLVAARVDPVLGIRCNQLERELAEMPEEAHIGALQDEAGLFRQELAEYESAVAWREQNATRLKREIYGLEFRIAELRQNNALIKHIKSAKLLVMEALWNRMLNGVSALFSQMRGAPSTVTRSKGGFLVDGHKRPSGSTKDILGLALRMVVTKMFTSCDILFLDEVASGCDGERAARVFQTAASAGFNQVLMITHNDRDETGDVNLIQL